MFPSACIFFARSLRSQLCGEFIFWEIEIRIQEADGIEASSLTGNATPALTLNNVESSTLLVPVPARGIRQRSLLIVVCQTPASDCNSREGQVQIPRLRSG